MPTTLENSTETIALNGGTPTMTQALPPRQRWGKEELEQLSEMLDQGSLFYHNGPQTQLLKERFQKYYPLDYVMPCSSGTAAIHIATQAAGVGPGDEVITSAITDMGTVIGVLYQQGVPVFADLEPHTYNLDVADVERKITPKTKAVIAVHLTGNPCDLDALRVLCDKHGIVLIEDCAQAWGAEYRRKPIGTVGHIGCWSLNDFKHISCGDGGIVASSDERFGPLLQPFGDKCYDRSATGARTPRTLAPNYRISEPQSAIAAAQMEKMWELSEKRGAAGRLLSQELQNVPGVFPHHADERDRWTCWFYLMRIDPEVLSCDYYAFARALNAEGLPAGAGYIQSPVYQYPLFQNHDFFAGRWPIKELGLTEMDYTTVCCPETEAILQTCIQISVNETTTPEWICEAATAIRKVAAYYAK
jgi:dTDP-4-amino-4,6-dideoxygalactose transaminase